MISTAQSRQQRQGEHWNDIFGAHEEVNQSVVEGPHTRGVEVGIDCLAAKRLKTSTHNLRNSALGASRFSTAVIGN